MRKNLLIYLLLVFVTACNQQPENTPAKKTAETKTNEQEQAAGTQLVDGISKVLLKAKGETMSEMSFEPTNITVKAGTKVVLTLLNLSKDKMMQHNFVLVQKGKADAVGVASIKAGASKNYVPDHPAIIAASEMVKPLGETVLEFDAPPPGQYVFICTYPGHHLAMRGRFTVE